MSDEKVIPETNESAAEPKQKLGSDACECGDYRCEHLGDGKCRVCGNGHAPYDGCTKFRFSHRADEAEQAIWEMYHVHCRTQPTPVEAVLEAMPESIHLVDDVVLLVIVHVVAVVWVWAWVSAMRNRGRGRGGGSDGDK